MRVVATDALACNRMQHRPIQRIVERFEAVGECVSANFNVSAAVLSVTEALGEMIPSISGVYATLKKGQKAKKI